MIQVYIIAGVLLSVFGLIAGLIVKRNLEANRKVREERERTKKALKRQKDKDTIMMEVFGDAEKKKADITAAGTDRNRFNAATDSLRNNKP